MTRRSRLPGLVAVLVVAAFTAIPAIPHSSAGRAQTPVSPFHLSTASVEPAPGDAKVTALLRALPSFSTQAICGRVLGAPVCPAQPRPTASGAAESNVWLNQSTVQLDSLASNSASLAGLADDPPAGYVVRFGGVEGSVTVGDTWSYHNGSWRNITSGAQPSNRFLPGMTFDYADGYVLLFGGGEITGSNITSFGDTWAFKNDQWSELVTPSAPSPRLGATMVYDPGEQGVVLFGGSDSFTGVDNDTWLYRAGNWTQLDVSGAAPSGRFATSLSWDATGDQLVAFGGAGLCQTNCSSFFTGRNDTWTFGNGSWNNITALTAPPVTMALAAGLVNVTAANELVLLVDLNVSIGGDCQTWAFSSGAWSQLAPTLQACGVLDPVSTWDSEDQQAIYFGGSPSILAEPTWAFASGTWTEVDNASYPGPLASPALAYDPGAGDAYLFGGSSSAYNPINAQTYRFDGFEWHVLTSGTGPAARSDAVFAYDPTLGGLVLYGGSTANQLVNDTWLLKDGLWSQVASANASPPGRSDAAAAFDPILGGLVIFGGVNATDVTVNDTWLLNGSTWAEVHPALAPSPRFGAVMAYDPALHADVLFGGDGGYASRSLIQSDTWEFHGGSWEQVTTSVAPAARAAATFVHDPAAGGDVLYGGVGVSATLGDTWRFTANGWALLPSTSTPSPRTYSGAYFDTSRDTLWLFGGIDFTSSYAGYVVYGELYELDTLTATGSVNVTAGDAPLAVAFSAVSSGGDAPVSLGWTFGDNQSSGVANTTHVYGRGGNFTARLTATDALGVSATWAVSIDAFGAGPLPVYLTASASPISGDAPLTVNFTSSATGGVGPYSFGWDFGDSTVATGANASHTYDSAGVFNATITATDSVGSTASRSFSINATLTPPPPPPPSCCAPPPVVFNVSINASALSGTAPATLEFTANLSTNAIAIVNVDYAWTFSDGGAASGAQVSHVFGRGGTFSVSVKASDGVGDTATAEINVTIAPAPPSGTSPLGGGVPVTDLLLVIVVAAVLLVVATSYLARSARRSGRRAPGRGPTDAPEPPATDAETGPHETG